MSRTLPRGAIVGHPPCKMMATPEQRRDYIDAKAREALDLMNMITHDTFSPRSAVRCVEGYDTMTEATRIAINDALDKLIAGETP